MTEETLFHEALAKPPSERAAFLDAACAGQPELRASIEALLRAHEASGSLLDKPAGNPVQTTDPESAQVVPTTVYSSPRIEAGTVIASRYSLQEKIGEGGMGEVWVAKQTEPVKRKVALKLIKPGMDSKAVLARFEQERQALALMDHPNIARVLDGGLTPSGRPFFVMDLVNGMPLTKFCDEARLTPKERLELFVPICQAVQHAHQKGIVHRDLKPANILVTLIDGKAIPKVIDFGVAKATGGKLTEEPLSTQFGVMVGTLEYMSPEQAGFSGVDVDTRADIYSLGVILYELLTGLRPFDGKRLRKAAHAEMLRIIQEEEPSRPSTRLSTDELLLSLAALRHTEAKKLLALLRGELDWVVMKCLEKSRERRYETANGLTRDIQRYLADAPVEARPPSVSYRLGKFLKRNKGPVVAASLVLLALIGGIIGTTWGLMRATTAEGIANQRYEEAKDARERAIASALNEAEQRKKAEKAEANTLADYRASTDDAIEQLIGSKPELGPKERVYLENTLHRWQGFAARQGDDERSQTIRAEGHFRVAVLWQKLGRHEEARIEYEAARAISKKLVEQFPSRWEYQLTLARTQGNLGLMLDHLGMWESARTEHLAARDLLTRLCELFPSEPAYKQELARTHGNLGVLCITQQKEVEARKEYQAARDLQQKLVDEFPAQPYFQAELALSHLNLGNLDKLLGMREEARVEYEAARDLQKKLVKRFSSDFEYQKDLALTHCNLGQLLEDLHRTKDAQEEYKAARGLQTKLVELFTAVPTYQQALATTLTSLGNLLRSIGKLKDAESEVRPAQALQKKLVEQFPAMPEYQRGQAITHNSMGRILAGLKMPAEARVEYEMARDLEMKLVARFPDAPKYQQDLALTRSHLASLLSELGKREAARTEYEAGGELLTKLVARFPAVPGYREDLAKYHHNLGLLLAGMKKGEEALVQYELSRDFSKTLTEQFPNIVQYQQTLALTHNNMGALLVALGKREEALKEYQITCDLREKLVKHFGSLPSDRHNLAATHYNLGNLLVLLGKRAEASAEYHAALNLQKILVEQFPGNTLYQIELGSIYLNMARPILEQGKPADSMAWVNLAIRTLKSVHDQDQLAGNARNTLRNSYVIRATVYERLKKPAEAVHDLDQAIELSPAAERQGLRVRRANSLVQAGRISEAVTEVAELSKYPIWPAAAWYDFACVYSVASGKSPDNKQQYADRAMALLLNAVKAGYMDTAHMAKDTDLDLLRDREDFKKLLAELKKKTEKQP